MPTTALDGEATGWTIIDSIGNLDGGTSDFAYAAINFSTDTNGTSTTGTIIDTSVENGIVGFTPDYLARIGNSTGSTLGDWLAADVNGTGPIDFAVDPLESIPNRVSNALDHIGAVNPVFSACSSRRHCH
ncbi:MAG: hypothetical protein R3C02_13590 [Planctomycetaceae bacterium]